MYYLLLTALFSQLVVAQTPGNGNSYTVWASVVLNRIGERTPKYLVNGPQTLTTTGAQQMYAAGQFFRNRYLTTGDDKIHGMSSDLINAEQLYTLAYDEQAHIASAQAFMQGLYPPTTPNTTSSTMLDPTSIYNSTYVAAPLNGYQYPQVHVSNTYDPDHIYISGSYDCPAYDFAAGTFQTNADFLATQNASRALYQSLHPLINNVPAQALDFANAYAIYDYVSYQALHNATFLGLLPQHTNGMDVASYLAKLRYLADQEQQHELANMTAVNQVLHTTDLPQNTTGSISTIAGNFLAAKIFGHLQTSIATQGQFYKLNTLFTDFESMLSLFALMSLPHTSTNFTGLPQYGSSAVFELYSWSNITNNTYPSADSMYVAFHFRNGSDPSSQFLSYPAFERGPSQTFMSWFDFSMLMYNIMLDDVGSWCTQCASPNLFCAAWNSTLSTMIAGESSADAAVSTQSQSSSSRLSPAVAGVIGAIIALAIAALIFALVMLLAGIRFHRRPSRKTSESGGFKGSAKLASDCDLILPPAETEDGYRAGAHERSGSWEMKNNEKAKAGSVTVMPTHQERKRAREAAEDELHVNPSATPVQARESF